MAVVKLADEVACLANSPGGGALILGVEDGTGVVLGTELSTEFLSYDRFTRKGKLQNF